jgi:maltooligosyltrehalose trehalohydrolase
VRCLAPVEHDGFGLDAMWNDDFHHSARVALTGSRAGYLHDYRGRAPEFVAAAKRAFLFQGQYYDWQKKPRGSPVTTEPAWAFIHFIQNHDQVANTFYGQRLSRITSPGRCRAMTALLLLAPQTPMLFMGQEFAASQPFPFFADHRPELAGQVHEGRREFLTQFRNYAAPSVQVRVPDPAAEETFRSAKLDFSERRAHEPVYALHKDLLRLRRDDPVLAAQDWRALDAAVLGERAFVVRWFDAQRADRLLVVNLGDELDLTSAPEPLLAAPAGMDWQLAWSSDDPRYDGNGTLSPYTSAGWRLPAESAALLRAMNRNEP